MFSAQDPADSATTAAASRLTPVTDYLATMVGARTDHPAMPGFADLRRFDGTALAGMARTLLGDGRHPLTGQKMPAQPCPYKNGQNSQCPRSQQQTERLPERGEAGG
jgi:hypothetical protein